MPRQTLALLLIPALLAGGPTPAQQAARIPLGSPVNVTLLDSTRLCGRLLQLGSTTFDLQTANGNTIETRTLRFDDTRSIKASPDPQRRRRLIGLIAVGGLFAILFATAATGLD